ncbi:MAG: hypothetical protein ABI616_06405 [Pseudomonadota bacterium]
MKAKKYTKSWALAAVAIGLCVVSGVTSAACLQKTRPVKGLSGAQTFMVAQKSEVADYAKLGFSEVQCPKDMSVFRQYVEKICSSSNAGSIPSMNTEIMFGRNRELACNSARAGLTESGG